MLLKGGSLGDRGPPSSGPGRGTLRACASLQLGAEALTAPVLPCHREPSWGVDSFLPGSWAATQPLPLALLVRTPPRYCECAPPGDEAGVPATFSALPGHGPLLLAIAESGSAGRRGGPAGPKQCWGGDSALSHSQCLPVAAWGSRDQNLPWDSRVRYTAPP